MAGLIESGPFRPSSRVVPSGVAFATASAPIMPPPPLRLSMMTCWPSTGATASASMRPTASAVPPAG